MCYLLFEHPGWCWFCYWFRLALVDLLLMLLLMISLSLSSSSSLPMSSNTSYLKNTTKHENSLCIAFSLIFGWRCRYSLSSFVSIALGNFWWSWKFCGLRMIFFCFVHFHFQALWRIRCVSSNKCLMLQMLRDRTRSVNKRSFLILFLLLLQFCCCCYHSFTSWRTWSTSLLLLLVVVALLPTSSSSLLFSSFIKLWYTKCMLLISLIMVFIFVFKYSIKWPHFSHGYKWYDEMMMNGKKMKKQEKGRESKWNAYAACFPSNWVVCESAFD